MSSVLHPVGPEPRERYWVRRLAVLIAAIVAIGIVIALVGNAMSAGSAVQGEPAAPTIVPPTLPPVVSASPTPGSTASPTPGSAASPTPAATATPGTATASPTPSGKPTDGSVVKPKPGQTAKTQKATPPTAAEKKRAAAAAAEKKLAAKKKAAATVLASCPTGDLRPTLTGPKKTKVKKSTTFAVSLINGSSKNCYLKVTSSNFKLTVVSGKDKIWSSEDCSAVVPVQSRKLAPQKSLDWKITWNGQRAGSDCSKQRASVKAGYYWAIARFDDAKEVRWRIILT